MARVFISNIAGVSDINFDVNVDLRGNDGSEQREAMRRELDSVRLESRRTLDSLQYAVADAQVSFRTALNRELDSERLEFRSTLDSLQYALSDAQVSFRAAFTGDKEPIDPELLESDKKLLYDEIARAIRDYGTTLSSLPDDEFIIVSVNWSTRETTLPERTYIRLKKNQLSTDNSLDIHEVPRN